MSLVGFFLTLQTTPRVAAAIFTFNEENLLTKTMCFAAWWKVNQKIPFCFGDINILIFPKQYEIFWLTFHCATKMSKCPAPPASLYYLRRVNERLKLCKTDYYWVKIDRRFSRNLTHSYNFYISKACISTPQQDSHDTYKQSHSRVYT